MRCRRHRYATDVFEHGRWKTRCSECGALSEGFDVRPSPRVVLQWEIDRWVLTQSAPGLKPNLQHRTPHASLERVI